MHRRTVLPIPVLPLLLLAGACADSPLEPPPPDPAAAAVFPATGMKLTAVAAGWAHGCGLVKGGQAWCWGANFTGQLGSSATGSNSFVPVPVFGTSSFSSVSAGKDHTCGVSGGSILCWGANAHGQLGDGTTDPHDTPQPVAGGYTFIGVTTGRAHTCGLTKSGQVLCWGSNQAGQLGTGTSAIMSTVPVPVSSTQAFAQIDTGPMADHTCAIAKGGQAYCWGSNATGQLGSGSDHPELGVPTMVAGGFNFTSIAVGGSADNTAGSGHTCALTKQARAYCWGANQSGELGIGAAGSPVTLPAPVAGGLTFTSLAIGRHTCGISGGAAYCWGTNYAGELGTGSSGEPQPVPTAVIGGFPFTTITAGSLFTCGTTAKLGAWCWGTNTLGELGAGAAAGGWANSPVPVADPR